MARRVKSRSAVSARSGAPERSRSKRDRTASVRAAAKSAPAAQHPAHAGDVAATRELFWQNVMREILTNLSMVSGRGPSAGAAAPSGAEGGAPDQAKALPAASEPEASEEMELFDGRLAVITRQGQRVAIASVFPLFACGIATPAERALSMDVECTVFQIRTPNGEVFTLPLEEMRTFHALTPELMHKLERAARRQARRRGGPREEEQIPFGFAAFTSMSRGGPSIVPEAPTDPTE